MIESLVIMTEGKTPSRRALAVRREAGLTSTLLSPLSTSRECSF